MSLPDGYRLIALDRARAADMIEVTSWAFSGDPKPEDLEQLADVIPFSRATAVEVDDAREGAALALAGVSAAYTFAMRVPGGAAVPVAGLTWVGVHPGHRRRGLLRAMIAEHLAQARARGEVASALWAAEAAIYQRFGYGLAARHVDVRVPRGATLRPVPGSEALRVRLERLDLERHGTAVAAIQGSLPRPGSMGIDHAETLRSRFGDPPEPGHQEKLRIVLVEESDGTPVAYAMFRRTGTWEDGIPAGVVHAREMGALTPAAAHRLWSVLLDLDLMSTVEADPLAWDDPVLWMLEDVRGARLRSKDNLWLRLVDVPAALAARTYLADVDAVIEVDDALVPENAGRWRLKVRDGVGSVAPAPGAEPDVALGIQELGAAYLGGVSLTSLAAAGLVEERRAGALARLSAALGSDVAPVCNLHF